MPAKEKLYRNILPVIVRGNDTILPGALWIQKGKTLVLKSDEKVIYFFNEFPKQTFVKAK